MIEQPHDGSVTELLLDPRHAYRGLLEVARLMSVGRDAARQPGLDQVARRLGLAPAVKPADRAEIDDERAHPAQRARQIVVVPQGVIALGMGQHWHQALDTELK